MKKMFLLFVLLGLTVFGSAQKVNGVPMKDIDSEYAEVIVIDIPFSSNKAISVDFGQKNNMFSFDKDKTGGLRTDDGRIIKFNSVVDALNFLHEYHYEFLFAYVVDHGGSNGFYYHYLLRKNRKPVE